MHTQTSYSNPIIRGFNPDPSVIRTGDDYWLVTSSFEYFPGIPVYHSRNLVDWQMLGHVFHRDEQLDMRGIDDSHGIWAPDISYHNGTYYVFATLRLNGNAKECHLSMMRRQMVFTAKHPAGPWSMPSFIDIEGIDPSHFVDDDGKHYMLLEPGVRLIPLSDDCTKATGEPQTIWPGTGERCPEGPHILKKDGWYYAILAEGGTGYGHRISVGRSRNLRGPYEPSPYNPVMMQTDENAVIQRTGHGKLVQTQHGQWWCVYLCGRRNAGNFTTLGRETCLDPVQWTEDGWFTINHGKGPSSLNNRPEGLPLTENFSGNDSCVDIFDSPNLPLHWNWSRNPRPGSWRIAEGRGLELTACGASLGSIHIDNMLFRRETEHSFTAECTLRFTPQVKREEAGMVSWVGFANWISCSLSRFDDGTPKGGAPAIRLCACINGERTILGQAEINTDNEITIRQEVQGQRRIFSYREAGTQTWKELSIIEDASFMCGEMVTVGKAHTGTLIGLYAANGGTGVKSIARFTQFSWQT